MSKLQTRNAFSNASLQDSDLFWIEVDLGGGIFESQKITGLQLKTILSQDPIVNDVVLIDQNTPTTGGVTFNPNTPLTQDILYLSTTNGSTWIYNGSAYVTYVMPVTSTTPFNIYGSSVDAGGNKTTSIQRTGDIYVGTNSLNSIVSASTGLAHTSNGFSQVFSTTYSNSEYPIIRQTRRRGTQASSTPAQSGDILGTHSFNSNGDAASISVKATETHGLTTRGSEIILSNCANGTASQVENLKVQQDGKIKVSNAYTLPSTAPTSGQVLGYSSAGVSDWVTPATGGIWGISNSSGIYTYYTTLTLAMASAVSGDTIEMFADVTESGAVTITHKSGVIINGNGHTYTLTSDTTDSNFYNNDANFNGDIINMKIVRSGRTAGTTTGFCLNYAPSGLASILKTSSVYCVNTFGTAVSGRAKFVGINGVGYLDGISNVNGQGVYNSYGESTTNGSGIDANAYNSTGVSVSGTGIGGGSQNSIGISTSGSGGNGTIRNSTLISTSGTAGNSGTFYNCTLISTSSYASSASNLYNCTLISSSGIAYNQSINSYTIQNCTIQSSTNRAMTINNATQVTNCRVLSSYNNVVGHAILCSSGTTSVITNNVLSVANVGASCIIGGASITSKYSSNVYIGSTTPVNANVTQGITNTQDSQGNILI